MTQSPRASGTVGVSVLVPAHNEGAVLRRTLDALCDGGLPAAGREVLVVCNGCTDDTVAVAEGAARDHAGVQVLEVPEPSKVAAVEAGNLELSRFPRIHLDADVVLDGASASRLVAALAEPGVHAAAPRRELHREGSSLLVRWYYDVWERLPQVRAGLFGRGVVALSEQGQARVSALPRMMSDDLAMSEAFDDRERRVVEDAVVVVRIPRTTADLLRRRVRVVTGNRQADEAGVRGATSQSSSRSLLRLALAEPRLLPRVPVFLAVTLVARRRARKAIAAGDFHTWQRDESSRAS